MQKACSFPILRAFVSHGNACRVEGSPERKVDMTGLTGGTAAGHRHLEGPEVLAQGLTAGDVNSEY